MFEEILEGHTGVEGRDSSGYYFASLRGDGFGNDIDNHNDFGDGHGDPRNQHLTQRRCYNFNSFYQIYRF